MSRAYNILHHLTCRLPTRFVRAAWLSIQPDGSVSFGLSDKAFISPRFRDRIGIWNAFNRVTTEFAVVTDPSAAEQVINPHFTFHPPHLLHLKSNKDKARQDESLFQGILDLPLMLEEEHEVKWINAITAPLRDMRKAGLRWKEAPTNDFEFNTFSEDVSVKLAVDFIRPADVDLHRDLTTWCLSVTEEYAVRVRASMTNPQFATLGWFHHH